MGKQTTLWLLLAVAGLGLLVWWQRDREERQDIGAIDVALFEGVQIDRVRAMRVDHIERGAQFRFERDARGAWYITDPILYPADLGVIALLLEVIGQSRAMLVPEAERDAAELGFEPPRAVFSFEEEVDGAIRERTLELGYLDVDGLRLNVRYEGRFLRILRKLDTTLKRSLNDYRSRRVLQIPAHSLVELNRDGEARLRPGEEPVDMRLNAVRDGDQWRSLLPYEALLDPLDFLVVLHGAGTLAIDRFADDDAVDLAEYGLDEPDFTIELVTADGARELLEFARPAAGRPWYVRRVGEPFVWGVAPETMQRLTLPYDELADRSVLRVAWERVDALRFEDGARTLRVARTPEGWSVSERRAGEAGFGPTFPAETARVEEVLSELEHLEVAAFLPGEPFPQDAPRLGVYVEVAGETLGCRLGPERGTDDGRPARLYQRMDDELVGLVDPWLGELARSTLADLRTLELAAITEVEIVGLELERGDERRRFVRGDRGRWTAAGADVEALELLPLLDGLLFLRASEHLPADRPVALEDPIEVTFERRDGSSVRYRIGLLGGRALAEVEGALSALKLTDLHARLVAFLGG